jgi:hypothetical protein
MGRKVEMEHVNDPTKAEEISMDHLTEFPNYYTALDEMEKKLEKKKEKSKKSKKSKLSMFADSFMKWAQHGKAI